MKPIRAAGVIVYRDTPDKSILLMQHPDRWDFPKGHVDDGESEMECALRELEEETGIRRDQIELDPGFRFTIAYPVRLPRYENQLRTKQVTYFLGRLVEPVEIRPTEHTGFRWLAWNPPHRIQSKTIDQALEAIEKYWTDSSS